MSEAEFVNLTIDGRPIRVPKGSTVYTACKQLGIEIPIFCYHDRMPPFGACRVCLVEVEKMGKLQTSCTLVATEGMVVKTDSTQAVSGREGIMELLLINHPLDCPICDRGGECPLQDQAIRFGSGKSRFYDDKRLFKKPWPLGPVLMLDRERCITCARCTRFGDEIAGDHALEFIERGYKTEVGTPEGGPAVSKFIGNTIQICPVGALTSQVYRFRARPWDNFQVESTCTLCPIGCSQILDSRDGEIMRTRSLENRNVNDIWLCDKGWFGYEFSSHKERLDRPHIRRGGAFEPISWDEAIQLTAAKLAEAIPNGRIAAFGGNPLTVEENYLLQALMRKVAKVNHIDHRIGMPILSLDEEGETSGMQSSFADAENVKDAVLLGLDITEEFPLLWLRLKIGISRGAKVAFIGHFAPEVSSHLHQVILHPPGKELEVLQQQLDKGTFKGEVYIGKQYLASSNRAAILHTLKEKGLTLNLMEGRNNSWGAHFAGMRPDNSPMGQAGRAPGLNALQVIHSGTQHGWDFLLVAGANPAVKYPSSLFSKMRERLQFLVVQDLYLTETAQQADLVLPTLCCFEKEGSFINVEGRVGKLRPGKEIPEGILSDGEIFSRIAESLKSPIGIDPEFSSQLKQEKVAFAKRETGKKPEEKKLTPPENNHLAATFAHSLFDRGVRMEHNPHLIQEALAPFARIHPLDANKRGLKDGDLIKIRSEDNVISGRLKWDEKVAEGGVVLPLGFKEIPVHELGQNLLNGMLVEVVADYGS